MMYYSSIVGLPVIISNKTKIAVVLDVFYCSMTKSVLGLIVKEKGLFTSYKYIPLDEIEEIQKTYVKVNNISSIKEISSNDKLYKTITNPNKCSIETDVYIKGGNKLGKIKDIAFNFELGIIDNYIISNGIIEDLVSGRKVIDDEGTIHKKGRLLIKKLNNKIKK